MIERKLPAYPLFVKDPNFSLWSEGELLNESHVKTWWGGEKRIYGLLRTGGKVYCFLGKGEDWKNCGVEPAKQTALSVTAFSTEYEFRAGEARLKLRFVSPLPPDDWELFSLPVCYMEYELEGVKEGEGAELSVFVSQELAFHGPACGAAGGGPAVCGAVGSEAGGGVRGGVMVLDGFESAFMGRRRQLPLSLHGDALGADWGYFYLAGERGCFLDEADLASYLAGGGTDFTCRGEERYIGALCREARGAVLLGYDDRVSIDYFGDLLKGYYLEKHTITEALEYVYHRREWIEEKLTAFDRDLRKRCEPYGEEYLDILYASLRQSAAAHKLVRSREGEILFLSKECCSNGCIATVDVSYPSIPLYLLYDTELVKGMMRPILKFAKMPVWPYDFAPHDAGTYPACCGQVYGLKTKGEGRLGRLMKERQEETHFPLYLLPAGSDIYEEEEQMPVEECANMLILFLACYHFDGDIRFFAREAPLAGRWVEFLVRFGLQPENQLCTDDFAGHLKNNVNLAIKAAVGIAAYARLAGAAGDGEAEARYRGIAQGFADQITAFGEEYGHLPLTWDSDGSTFSLKYNLAFDKILGLNLFSQEVREREVDCCLERLGRFGTPLDNRAGYTKSDWLLWMASLTESGEKQRRLVAVVAAFLRESPDRAPFVDWYESESGKMMGFRARSVQGGCFALLL